MGFEVKMKMEMKIVNKGEVRDGIFVSEWERVMVEIEITSETNVY